MSVGSNQFTKKGYGRIYVLDPGKISQAVAIVRSVDESECSYYPEGLIVPWEGKVELIFTHKFESCMDTITLRCWRERIAVWCISQRNEFFGDDHGAFRCGRTRILCRMCDEGEGVPRETGWTHVHLLEGVGWICRECGNNGHWDNRHVERTEE